MVAFYNQADQDIYKTDKFMPQSRFLLDAPKPVVEKEKVTESFGIPQTQAFNNSGGGVGGGYYPGPAGDLATGFQSTVNARQNRLNNPSNTFLGFNTMRDQQLTGADAGEYIGSGTNVPQEQTLMGKAQSFLNPQSAQGILEDGYQEPRFQPGIMATIMGKMDNYRNLSRTDQAFIAQNMGYTGPTVFGENNSGLGKDPFGINTRSALGNYGEFVDKKSGQLTDTLTKQGGKIFDKYAVNPITGQALDEEEFSYDPITGQYIGTNAAAIAKANKMNKMNLTQLGFYRGKKIEKQTIIDNKKAADLKAFEDQKARSGTTSGANDGRYENINDRNRGGQGAFQEDKTSMKSAGKSYQDAQGNVGYSRGRKDGGRIGYFFGGRARLQGGGMSQGNESNISQSTNMGGGTSGDFSTGEQTINHNRVMRNNLKEKPSIVNNAISVGSELNYLNNLKNLNLPGIALGFGVNKFRDFIGNKKTKEEEDKLSALPTNNYFAEVQKKDLDASKMTGFKQQDYPSYKNQMDMFGGTKVTPYEFKGLQDGTITTTGTFTAANGGRAMFKNGGLASIL